MTRSIGGSSTLAGVPQSTPAVSIVIPARDRCALLAETLDSVFAQRFDDCEVLVVDDGSIDGTAELLASFGDGIRVLHGGGAGVAAARNEAIGSSRGRYVAFLDSDDLWHPQKLEIQVRRLEADAGIALVFSDYHTFEIDSDGQRRCVETMEHRGDVDFAALFRKNFIGASTVVVRREVFDAVGLFDTHLDRGSDFEMWLRIARRYRIAQVPRMLVEYRRHPKSLSGTDVEGVLWTYREVTGRLIDSEPDVLERIGLSWLEYERLFHERLAERNERFGRHEAAALHRRRAKEYEVGRAGRRTNHAPTQRDSSATS